MNQAERRKDHRSRNARRSEKIENLAAELNVSVRTIKYDIEALACSYPIESVRGRYGGVKLADWYQPSRRALPGAGRAAGEAPTLTGDDLAVMNSIFAQFAP